MVAPEVPAFFFHASLLVAARRVAELALKTPVRTKRDEPTVFLSLVPAQDLLHCTFQVVESKQREHPAEILERQLVRFQKSLLAGMRIGSMERSSAGHRSHAEDVHLLPLAIQLRPGFIPIHLSFAPPVVALRHKRFP